MRVLVEGGRRTMIRAVLIWPLVPAVAVAIADRQVLSIALVWPSIGIVVSVRVRVEMVEESEGRWMSVQH